MLTLCMLFFFFFLLLQGIVPESKGIIVVVLLADLLNTICREIILLTSSDNQQSAGIAMVVLFVLIVILFFTILSAHHLVCLYLKGACTPLKMVLLTMQTIGAVLYLYGDNISIIFEQYGEVLGCNENCMDNNKTAAALALAVALMFHHLFPSCLHKIAKHSEIKYASTEWYFASEMIGTILKIDALYTVVIDMTDSSGFCSGPDLAISVAFCVICVIITASLMAVYCTISSLELRKDSSTQGWCWIPSVAFVTLLICFPLHILADNTQPLDCAWGCDLYAGNSTLRCNYVGNRALRLGFTIITFLILTSLSLLLFLSRHNTKDLKQASAKAV